MIEVFKTNVCDPEHANSLLEKIHAIFYRAQRQLRS